MMTFVIIAGEIDLSVASVMGFSAGDRRPRSTSGGACRSGSLIVIALAAGSVVGLVQGW